MRESAQDGTTTQYAPDGRKIAEVSSDGLFTTYAYAPDGTATGTRSDGVVDSLDPQGRLVLRVLDDGTRLEYPSDGVTACVTRYPNHIADSEMADGSHVWVLPDGMTLTVTAGGAVQCVDGAGSGRARFDWRGWKHPHCTCFRWHARASSRWSSRDPGVGWDCRGFLDGRWRSAPRSAGARPRSPRWTVLLPRRRPTGRWSPPVRLTAREAVSTRMGRPSRCRLRMRSPVSLSKACRQSMIRRRANGRSPMRRERSTLYSALTGTSLFYRGDRYDDDRVATRWLVGFARRLMV